MIIPSPTQYQLKVIGWRALVRAARVPVGRLKRACSYGDIDSFVDSAHAPGVQRMALNASECTAGSH